MAENKRGGFRALEKRIHELEAQDRAAERGAGEEKEGAKREAAEKKDEKARK